MKATYGVVLLVIALLPGCRDGLPGKPAGMPEGYDRVDKAFGVRLAGLTEAEGMQRAPVVEFRANGDYAMYPLGTDCAGNFVRGQGLVFAPDGTVREQVTAQPMETLAESPQFGAVVGRICARYNEALAAIRDDGSHRKTRFGLLEIGGGDGAHAVTYRGNAVARGRSLAFEAMHALGAVDAVLVHDTPSGADCPGGEYFVVSVDASGANESNHFGDCAAGTAKVQADGPRLSVVLPSGATYVYADGQVAGGPDEMPDVSAYAADEAMDAAYDNADAAARAADAAADAADTAEMASRQAWNAARTDTVDLSERWMTQCHARSGEVTTPAGSRVALNDRESRQYCDCLWSRGGSTAANLVRRGGLKDDPSAAIPDAHAACVQDLM